MQKVTCALFWIVRAYLTKDEDSEYRFKRIKNQRFITVYVYHSSSFKALCYSCSLGFELPGNEIRFPTHTRSLAKVHQADPEFAVRRTDVVRLLDHD